MARERSSLLPLTALVAGLASGCTLGSVGGEASLCEQAVAHMASCGVTNLPDVGECTKTKQQLATRILTQRCEDVSMRTTFSGDDCDSIFSIFDSSCWSGDDYDDNDGDDYSGDDSSDDDYYDDDDSGDKGYNPNGNCFCDDLCHVWKDCCDDCDGGGDGGSWEAPEKYKCTFYCFQGYSLKGWDCHGASGFGDVWVVTGTGSTKEGAYANSKANCPGTLLVNYDSHNVLCDWWSWGYDSQITKQQYFRQYYNKGYVSYGDIDELCWPM